MQQINSREKLKAYIKSILGEPIHNVELTTEQMDYNIDTSINEFSEVAMEGQETKLLLLKLESGVFEYILDGRIKTIQNLALYNKGSMISNVGLGGEIFLTPTELLAQTVKPLGGITNTTNTSSNIAELFSKLSTIALYKKYFTIEINWKWNEYSKRLIFLEDPKSNGNCLLETTTQYIPNDIDYIYDNIWVKNYALELCRKTWGENLGKYDSVLVNGSKLNSDRIIATANEAIANLRAELMNKWAEPFGVSRG